MKRFACIILMIFINFTGSIYAQKAATVQKTSSKIAVEVLYFHGKQRCPTCIAIGNHSLDVVNKEFASQVRNGQVKFKEIDISTTEGEKIADKYHVTWSSLFVNQWKNGREKRNDMTTFGFKNARSNPSAFEAGLKNRITQLLKDE
ncbi:MAG: nitrophenyl compound nitroreductase subunit ArsF family protein [Parabacteroides sp.]|nr:nitrophenyl compound nitroreductase subunit ArsF family protein [Parabacteroides sp.]